jgi:hypothetical protein
MLLSSPWWRRRRRRACAAPAPSRAASLPRLASPRRAEWVLLLPRWPPGLLPSPSSGSRGARGAGRCSGSHSHGPSRAGSFFPFVVAWLFWHETQEKTTHAVECCALLGNFFLRELLGVVCVINGPAPWRPSRNVRPTRSSFSLSPRYTSLLMKLLSLKTSSELLITVVALKNSNLDSSLPSTPPTLNRRPTRQRRLRRHLHGPRLCHCLLSSPPLLLPHRRPPPESVRTHFLGQHYKKHGFIRRF